MRPPRREVPEGPAADMKEITSSVEMVSVLFALGSLSWVVTTYIQRTSLSGYDTPWFVRCFVTHRVIVTRNEGHFDV